MSLAVSGTAEGKHREMLAKEANQDAEWAAWRVLTAEMTPRPLRWAGLVNRDHDSSVPLFQTETHGAGSHTIWQLLG